ncbi:MAG: hypothetical protein K2Z81_22025 [Cyanobacteria bacterium]|nr:hypothetical protein [Cyanobacteriota bacterium]
MSRTRLEKAINDGTLLCPTCEKPVKRFDKFVELTESIWDGAGDSKHETAGSKVTLICGNEGCDWQDRTEYWEDLIED